jgi:hypothetical protein
VSKETWVPEEYIFESASECLEAFPDQAAARLFNQQDLDGTEDDLLFLMKDYRELKRQFNELVIKLNKADNIIKLNMGSTLDEVLSWKSEEE